MVNDFNGGLRRDSLKSNKNPNYGAAAQVARWLESSSPARAPSGLRSGAPGKLASIIIITRKCCLIWEISLVRDVEGCAPGPGVGDNKACSPSR